MAIIVGYFADPKAGVRKKQTKLKRGGASCYRLSQRKIQMSAHRNDIELMPAADFKPEDVIWLDGGACGHEGVYVKTTHAEMTGMVATLAHGLHTHRTQLLMEFRGCCRALDKTDAEKEVMFQDTKAWNAFCTDIAWMAAYRVVLMNAPMIILSKKCAARCAKK